jgi:formate transporter
MSELLGLDAFSPKQVAQRAWNVGVTKARLPFLQMFTLGILAGGFIGLGSLYFTVITSDTTLPFGVARLLGGLVFCLGLILVVVAGAELFTGNNLLTIAWASRKISTGELVKNWVIIWIANFIGSIGLVLIVLLADHMSMNKNGVGANAVKIASMKVGLTFQVAFFRGILCNILVCLAVWLAMAGRSVTDKIMAIIFPISAFVAAGFEHSVANMYFIPLGILLKMTSFGTGAVQAALDAGVKPEAIDALTWMGFLHNIVPVTLGNIVGGGVMVALVYYLVYRPGEESAAETSKA